MCPFSRCRCRMLMNFHVAMSRLFFQNDTGIYSSESSYYNSVSIIKGSVEHFIADFMTLSVSTWPLMLSVTQLSQQWYQSGHDQYYQASVGGIDLFRLYRRRGFHLWSRHFPLSVKSQILDLVATRLLVSGDRYPWRSNELQPIQDPADGDRVWLCWVRIRK